MVSTLGFDPRGGVSTTSRSANIYQLLGVDIMEDEHVGENIGVYEVLYLCDYKSNDGHKMYHIKCSECGWENDIQYRNIKALSKTCNHLTACGSYVNFNGKNSWKNQRIKSIFDGMRDRCYNVNSDDYRWYGQKGIKICNEWAKNPLIFEEWALSNGYNAGLTIDRIDSDKDYCPDNCQWIPLEENSRKAGRVNWITVNDETLTGHQWSEKLGLGTNTINTAIREHGLDKTKELIARMIADPPALKNRKPRTTWFSVYGIET